MSKKKDQEILEDELKESAEQTEAEVEANTETEETVVEEVDELTALKKENATLKETQLRQQAE